MMPCAPPPRRSHPARQLRPSELRLLRFIHGYLQAKGYGPTVREMAGGVGLSGLRQISEQLTILEHQGFVRRLPKRARAIEVLIPPTIPRTPNGAPLFLVPMTQQSGAPHGANRITGNGDTTL